MASSFTLAHRWTRLRRITVAAGLTLVASCSESTSPIGEESPIADVPVTTAPAADPSFSLGSFDGIPFGLYSGEYGDLGNTWTATKRAASVSSIKRYLEIARQRHARVFIQFSGSRSNYRNSDGSFSLTKWKNRVAAYKAVNLDSYIKDGTLAGHYLIDEPNDGSNWDGDPISYSTIEAAAKYSKGIWPGLTTVVRVVPTWLRGASFSWQYLDAAWAQYSARKGDVADYRDTQVAAAKAEGLGLVFSMNVLDGGNGSSGWRGTKSGKYNMSPSELSRYGKTLIGASYACAFLMWRYSDTYLSRSGVMTSMRSLSSAAKDRSNTACRR